MTTTGTDAYEAIRAHHRALGDGLTERANAVFRAAVDSRPHEPAVADFVAYVGEEILPHAAAEEKTIYPAVVAHTHLGNLIGEMITEHAALSMSAARLTTLTGAVAAADQAQEIAALFAAHAAKENDVLLPALIADGTVDLAELLGQMHHNLEPAAPASEGNGADPQAAVLTLLLQATGALARAGAADLACRIAASAWAEIHETRPDLATKVTTALHGLTRRVDSAAPDEAAHHCDCGHDAADPELDVRELRPAQRHVAIFDAYIALAPGTGFVLVNDHDPKPLRYQFEAEHAREFTWDALESGPEVWRVRIGRPHGVAGNASDEEPDLDVRQVAHFRRHDLIFTAYRALQPGRGFVLVNDHDPKPLRYQFEAQYAGEYSWDYLEAGPKVWRVRVGRALA
ncbi:MAG TPA: DUF2249 domain-containing protein [Trebonia sp.]|nr:DUF2249 domain-containing protein [Trebonia sp.]